MKILICFVLVAMIAFADINRASADNGPAQGQVPKGPVVLDFLLSEGHLLHCYYTVEQMALDVNTSNFLYSRMPTNRRPADVQSLIASLRAALPTMTISQDTMNGNIVHIAASSLLS